MQKTMKAEIAALNSESGEWRYSSLELPAKKYEIEDAMHRAGIVAAETYREYSLYGCELLPQLSQMRPDSPSIEELNYLAKRLSELNEEERLVLRAVAPKYLDTLSGIKGKFLLSYNDCEEIRALYEDFSILDFSRTHSMAQRYEAGKEFKELLIGNYDLYERERKKPRQLNMFSEQKDFDYKKILRESIIACRIKK